MLEQGLGVAPIPRPALRDAISVQLSILTTTTPRPLMCANCCIVSDDVGLHIPRVHLAKQGAGFPPAPKTSTRIDCLDRCCETLEAKRSILVLLNGPTPFIVKQATAQ